MPERAVPADGRAPVSPRHPLLALQRSAGNSAVAQLVAGAAALSASASAGADIAAHLSSPRFKGDQVLKACFDDRARLREGSSGAAVSKVQQALLELGLALGSAGVDGRYGPTTASAVKAFKRQEQLGFEQFGDVGPGTMHGWT